MKPTPELYQLLQDAYDYFNAHLFNNELPQCLITLQRKRGKAGYFWAEIFKTRNEDDDSTISEIALNPETFDRDERWVLSVLAHEMCHAWQEYQGEKQSRNGYHNKEWADKMLEIGLKPVSIDQPGKMTGQRVSHEIEPDGIFDRTALAFIGEIGTRIGWFSLKPDSKKNTAKNKIKYTCPGCNANVWGKPDMQIVCGTCEEEYQPHVK